MWNKFMWYFIYYFLKFLILKNVLNLFLFFLKFSILKKIFCISKYENIIHILIKLLLYLRMEYIL